MTLFTEEEVDFIIAGSVSNVRFSGRLVPSFMPSPRCFSNRALETPMKRPHVVFPLQKRAGLCSQTMETRSAESENDDFHDTALSLYNAEDMSLKRNARF